MRNPPRAAAFGPEYEQLLLTVWESTPFRFPTASPAAMRALRGKVYAYFRHLRQENLRLDLVEMADSLTLVMEDSTLIFQKHSETWDHQLIRNTLGITQDQFGLKPADGEELKSPDLLQNRLARQVKALRSRNNGGQNIVPPYKP